jgi:hypothetical protein
MLPTRLPTTSQHATSLSKILHQEKVAVDVDRSRCPSHSFDLARLQPKSRTCSVGGFTRNCENRWPLRFWALKREVKVLKVLRHLPLEMLKCQVGIEPARIEVVTKHRLPCLGQLLVKHAAHPLQSHFAVMVFIWQRGQSLPHRLPPRLHVLFQKLPRLIVNAS